MALLNVKGFQANLLRFAEVDVPHNIMRRQIEIALYLIKRLQDKTPIDTGFAVSNWRLSVDKIPSGTLGTYQKALDRRLPYRANDPYRFKVKGWPRPPLTGRTREQLIDTAFYRGQLYNATDWKKVGHVIYVFNNVHYMQYLENGHSQQAPKGWIQGTINETRVWMASKRW